MNTMSFDPFMLSLAEHDARMLHLQRARLEMNRLKHVAKAVHHRVRKAYYRKVGALGLTPPAVIGIEAKVQLLLAAHPEEDMEVLLTHLQLLQQRLRDAVREASEAEVSYLLASARLGTPALASELVIG